MAVESRTEYYALERDLRRTGFEARVGRNERLCRWTVDSINVDIMSKRVMYKYEMVV